MYPPSPSLPVELQAIDAARNIHRRYAIRMSRDLFGQFVVEAGWGRIGTPGRLKRRSFSDRAAAERHVEALLRRRRSAPGRIGVAYREVSEPVLFPHSEKIAPA